jgi:hypothetical protein
VFGIATAVLPRLATQLMPLTVCVKVLSWPAFLS